MTQRVTGCLEDGGRLDRGGATLVFREMPFHELSRLASLCRSRRHGGTVTYVVDRNINYTNVCVGRCRFCAFYRDPGSGGAYLLDRPAIFRKIEETIGLGGTGVLLQGGLHPELGVDYFEGLLRDIRSRFAVDLHCFSPPEVLHMAGVSGITARECLSRLKDAGLTSLPGGGAEILSDGHRKAVSPDKCTSDEWLGVMEAAHGLGLKSTATMMFGSGETLEHRLDHLERVRSLQDRTGGFVSFIPWTFQWPNTELGRGGFQEATAVEYLRMVALSRLFLDNVPSIQASWVTQGLKVAQTALFFGANDMGSVMVEENVVAAAGASNRADEADLRRAIADAGFRPQRRNCVHEPVGLPAQARAEGGPE